MAFGILALQGGFAEHAAMLGRLGAEHFEIRQLRDIQRPMDGLLLPGGESTVIGKLLGQLGLLAPLKEKIETGLPVFGTCAGLILLARQVEGGVPCFATMDISVKRNAYGRQLGSFFTEGELEGVGQVPMTFIRAPYIAAAGPDVQVLSQVDGHIVAARQGRQLVTAFHPELNEDLSIHRWFLEQVAK